MESIVESEPRTPRRESAMPKGSAREMAASEAAEMPAATHAATVHAASAAVAPTAATTASRERGWRESNRGTERGRDQATKELVVHLVSPWLKCSDECRRTRSSGERFDPANSTDKGDRF
jgi:hypothetical protein